MSSPPGTPVHVACVPPDYRQPPRDAEARQPGAFKEQLALLGHGQAVIVQPEERQPPGEEQLMRLLLPFIVKVLQVNAQPSRRVIPTARINIELRPEQHHILAIGAFLRAERAEEMKEVKTNRPLRVLIPLVIHLLRHALHPDTVEVFDTRKVVSVVGCIFIPSRDKMKVLTLAELDALGKMLFEPVQIPRATKPLLVNR